MSAITGIIITFLIISVVSIPSVVVGPVHFTLAYQIMVCTVPVQVVQVACVAACESERARWKAGERNRGDLTKYVTWILTVYSRLYFIHVLDNSGLITWRRLISGVVRHPNDICTQEWPSDGYTGCYSMLPTYKCKDKHGVHWLASSRTNDIH